MTLRLFKNPPPSRSAYSLNPNPSTTNPDHITITIKPAMLHALSTLLLTSHRTLDPLSPLMLRFAHDARRTATSLIPTPGPEPTVSDLSDSPLALSGDSAHAAD